MEELKKTGLQAAPADLSYAGPEDVACDVCTGRKLKAIKTCYICFVSYCEEHLQPHYESPRYEKHMLVEPSKDLQEQIRNYNAAKGMFNDFPFPPEHEPKTRADFLKYSREITLDPNTAFGHLLISEGNQKATYMSEEQSYSSHTDRFTVFHQALSTESLTGRCYCEVEWRGKGVCVAVAYKNISRAGGSNESGFGLNDTSWALFCDANICKFWHKKVQTPISVPQSHRIGVYLDHSAGVLSFYSVSETMTLLHRVQTTFTQPLYAGLYLYDSGDTAEFSKPT